MNNMDRVLATIAASRPVCDDCLSARAELRPRQQVNTICNALARATKVVRAPHRACVACGKVKLTNQTSGVKSGGVAIGISAREPDIVDGGSTSLSGAPRSLPPEGALPPESPGAQPRPWHWEGHVQDVLARFLVADGWMVPVTADTESKAPGADVIAVKDDRWLVIEVKGYPTTTYDHGPLRGHPKPTQPTNQARQWYSHALLSMMLLREKHPDAEVALGLPDFQTYQTLASWTRGCLEGLGFGVYFIGEDRSVRLDIPHRPCPQ